MNEIVRPARFAGAGLEMRMHLEAEALEQEIFALIEADPVGAAKSWIGRNHLLRFGFLLGSQKAAEEATDCRLSSAVLDWEYGLQFEIKDILLDGAWLAAQLVAEEYFEEGPERTPFTPEAFLDFDFSGKHVNKEPDPFETHYRPNVTMEAFDPATGKTIQFNLNGEAPTQPKPVEGFREVS